ncbi:MAG: Asp-tRNA(Asn)/Glu-tRNA(Gln) amidotransferase GatCAB subunit B, partial [Deltaproteobacteria bacterium]|nr:Asp-tRNA(Asn)/Glu-tRNA(Gln) amidotransferase GatCAB subunit B [Deltaproteobacteria bacterium]
RLEKLGLPAEAAATLVGDPELADYFDAVNDAYGGDAKTAANWVLGELLRELGKSESSVAECKVAADDLARLIGRVDDQTISGSAAKKVLAEMFATGDGADAIIERKGLKQIRDSGAIEAIAAEVIAANPAQAEQFRAGKDKLLGFFVGQVMKKSRGQANPQVAGEILRKLLSEES